MVTSFPIGSHAELLETNEKRRNDVMSEMSKITVLRCLSYAVVVNRARTPNASPVAESRVLTARVVTDRTFGCCRERS